MKFLIVAVIVLPMLPDRDLGPLGAINPRTLGLMVVTISGLSFLGYVAMRLYGAQRGLLVGAALGGLVSSTAVTLSFAGRTKDAARARADGRRCDRDRVDDHARPRRRAGRDRRCGAPAHARDPARRDDRSARSLGSC